MVRIVIVTRCEPEYFGFPDCQACSCPSTAKCDEVTGECICAPFVTGTAVRFFFLFFSGNETETDPQDAPCTMCEENTYGYNAVTGCQECSCRTEGTNGDMSCRYQMCRNQHESKGPTQATNNQFFVQFGLWAVQLCRSG